MLPDYIQPLQVAVRFGEYFFKKPRTIDYFRKIGKDLYKFTYKNYGTLYTLKKDISGWKLKIV